MPSLEFETFKITTWIIICVLGTIGNVLVVLVVYRKRKMKTVTNYFIVNLAIADLAVLLFNVPLDVAKHFTDGNWLSGEFMCHITRPIQTLATTASVWSLVAISISRYVAIVHPLKPQLRRSHARWMILPVWTLSLILVSPYMASLRTKNNECVEDFESVGMDTKYYTLGVFLAQYVLPLTIMAFAYIRVGQELTRNPNHSERTQSHYKETKKVLRMLMIVVFVFAILVLPLHVVYIWIDFFNANSFKYMTEIKSLAVIMLYGNSFTNPIIYNACNEEFRKSFRGYFRAWTKPCARLVLKENKNKSPEIFDDMGSTFHRTQGNGSFRRQSRKSTLIFDPTFTNNLCKKHKAGSKKKRDKNKDQTRNNTPGDFVNNENNIVDHFCNCHDTLLDKNCGNRERETTKTQNGAFQIVSVL